MRAFLGKILTVVKKFTPLVFIMQQLNINVNMSLHGIKSRLIKRSMELWGKQSHENAVIKDGKLRRYNIFKQISVSEGFLTYFFKYEPYLNVVNNMDVRKSFTRFRISAHDLAIERGRYKILNLKREFVKLVKHRKLKMKFIS